MEAYEYIFAAVIMVAILIAAIFLTGISPQLYRSTSEIEQLKMAAQKIMAQVMLSPGKSMNGVEDWGGDITIKGSNLSSFGLAVSAFSTREAFTLDPDKVQRLSRELGELYIKPEEALKMLNLGSYYGIALTFIPALNIDVSWAGSDITIEVLTEQGMPASNVSIVVGAFHVQDGRVGFNLARLRDVDGDGRCDVSFPFNPELLIVVADYYGIRMVNVTSSFPYRGYFIGRYLLTSSSSIINDALQVFAVSFPNGTIALMGVTCSLEQWINAPISDYRVYNVSYVEPNAIAVVALTEDNKLMVAHKIVPTNYSSTASEVYPPLAYMLERSVKIGLSTYTLRLKVWRMSW